MTTHKAFSTRHRRMIRLAATLGALACGTAVQAQVTLDVIGPHEYDLPVGFKPFNVFVQYGTIQNGNKLWNGSGDRRSANKTDTLVGLSKFVHFWSLESNPNIGMAYEVIVPEVGVRDRTAHTSASGIGDPITGPAIWYKPSDNSTLGFQTFLQIPVGDKDVGGGDVWKNLSSLFWDVQMGKLSYTADAGFVFFGKSTAADAHPGTLFHTNHRLGYAINEVIEPFVALDYERQKQWTNNVTGLASPSANETTAGIGVMLKYYGNQSLTVRYSAGIDGKNHGTTNSLNLKYVYSW